MAEDRRSVFEKMSTERLEELLRLDFYLDTEDSLSGEELLLINEILSERQPEQDLDLPSAAEMWQRFEQDYLEGYESGSLYEEIDGEEDAQPILTVSGKKPSKRRFKWFTMTRVASILLVILLAAGVASVSAEAAGFGSWDAMAKLAYGTFRWNEDGGEKASLGEVLAAYDMTEAVAPSYVPKGYTLDWVNVSQDAIRVNFYAKYENRDADVLTVLVTYYFTEEAEWPTLDKSGGAEVYLAGDIEHHITTKSERCSATWVNGRYECTIAGGISSDEMKKMIDSVYGS